MSWTFLLDLKRGVAGILRPAHGGTGSTYGERRVVEHYLNSTGATLALYTLVQLSAGANDVRVKKVTDTNSTKVLGVVVGYFDGTGDLVEAAAPDGYEVAVQTAGRCPILIESAVSRDQYAFAAATDGKITSSATAAAGAFGRVVESADVSTGQTTATVAFPLTAFLGAGSTPAPVGATYLTKTADPDLTNEEVVGNTPGGQLAGAGSTWASPVVHNTHGASGVQTHHAQSHDHTGADGTPKITQARSHESPDTDSADGALHHTLGTASNNAAKGNHSHGSSGTSIPIYIPDAPPASAHANDDECADNSVAAGWTEWDHGSILTPSEDSRGLIVNPTNASTGKLCGVYKAVQADANAVMCKVTMANQKPGAGESLWAGLLLLENGATSTADAISFMLETATAAGRRGINVARWDAYNTFNAFLYAQEADGYGWNAFVYLRIRRSSGVYYYDWSSDGEGWTEIFNHTPPFAPTHVGLGVWKGGAVYLAGHFRFYRQIADVTLDKRINGQVLNL